MAGNSPRPNQPRHIVFFFGVALIHPSECCLLRVVALGRGLGPPALSPVPVMSGLLKPILWLPEASRHLREKSLEGVLIPPNHHFQPPRNSLTFQSAHSPINKSCLFQGSHHFSIHSIGRVSLTILSAKWPEAEVQEDIICKTCKSEKLQPVWLE